MSEQILSQFLQKGLLTHVITPSEFEEIVLRVVPDLDSATIKTLYMQYEDQDARKHQDIKTKVDRLVESTRLTTLSDLEHAQLDETVSLESIVDSLYSINQLMDDKLALLNKSIQDKTMRVQEYNLLFQTGDGSSANEVPDDLISTLKKYNHALQQLEEEFDQQQVL